MSLLEKRTFKSPFPDKKNNKTLVDFSRCIVLAENIQDKNFKVFKHYNFKSKDIPEKIKVNVTSNNLKKYMYNNTFYYDLKNWKEFNKPTHINTKIKLRSTEKPIKEPIFKDKKERSDPKYNAKVNHTYLASIVNQGDIERILTYKDDHNTLNLCERERPMIHDNNAFKSRPLSTTKTNLSNRSIKNNSNLNEKNIKSELLKTTKAEPFLHKNFSEIPDYIRQFRARDKIEKEYEKLIEEESTYPKGTSLIPEESRLHILNELNRIMKYLINCIEKCPVTINFHSTSVINKKIMLDKRLDEVEKHLEIFNKRKVFMKK